MVLIERDKKRPMLALRSNEIFFDVITS